MRYVPLISLFAGALLAQVSDGITVNVTGTGNIAPDEAAFSVTIPTTLDVTQAQVSQAFADMGLQDLSITRVSLIPNYSSSHQQDSYLIYQVAFTTPLGSIKDYSRKIDALNAKLPDGWSLAQYSASLAASKAALDAAHQSVLPQLLSDARAKAQQLASAAGLRAGTILAISEGTPSVTGTYAFGTFQYVVAAPEAAEPRAGTVTAGAPYTFYATVTFAGQ